MVISVVLVAVLAPWIAPHDPYDQDIERRLKPPAWNEGSVPGYSLGTDPLGHDILSRLIHGARISLTVAVLAVLVSGTLGVILGVVAGYFGGRIDNIIMRVAEVQMAFPLILLAIAVMFVLGSGLRNLILVIGITGWVTYGRVVRSEVLALKNREFVEAARALGNSPLAIMVRHVVPNVFSSVIVVATLEVARVIIMESALTFLGLGVDPRIPSWGGMLADGRQYLNVYWWVAVFPGLAIMFTVLGVNLVGDWLRDTLDPRVTQ
jgi:peptide/nickel transport system permease protein